MKLTTVRLMNDYGANFPLWDSDGATDAEDWALSPQLSERLTAWAACFQEHFHEEHGFSSAEEARKYRSEGFALRALVAEELGSRYKVIGNFSETDDLEHPLHKATDRIIRVVTGRWR